MPVVRDMSAAQIAFQVGDGAVDQFMVSRYHGTEGLSRLFRFEIDVTTLESDVDFSTIVGRPAVLSINGDNEVRWFHGIVSRFELVNEFREFMHYRVELVPRVWLLTHRYCSRIYQAKSTVEIITDVLTRGGVSPDRFRFETSRDYQPREYCVQYRETDYNFISRLMEHEGIFWYFEQSEEGHTLVMADNVAAYRRPESEEEGQLPYQPDAGQVASAEFISRFRLSQSVRPGAVVLNDFNFKNPQLKLESAGDIGRDPHLAFNDFPGEYDAQSSGAELATLRAEEFESGRVTGTGVANSYKLSPCTVFELIDHPSNPTNGKYLVTSVQHRGRQSVSGFAQALGRLNGVLTPAVQQSLISARSSDNPTIRDMAEGLLQITGRLQAGDPTAHRSLTQWLYHAGQISRDPGSSLAAQGGDPLSAFGADSLLDEALAGAPISEDTGIYQNRFECIPDTVTFRPPRITPWPEMRGSQTAIVVGPGGEEIHTDEFGRIKVKFPWDRVSPYDDTASCWIRVSQGMAGGQYGMMFLPRVGQEVVVDFLEGSPDKPLVVGRVYNADHMPPYKLPDEKTKSCIKTNSSKGGGGTNEIRFEDLAGSEQLLFHAEKDLHERAKNDRVASIGRDDHLIVKRNRFDLVKENEHSIVKLDRMDKTGGNHSIDVSGAVARSVGGNWSEDSGGNIYIKATGSIILEAGSQISLKVGGNFVDIGSSGVAIMGSQVLINSGGSAGVGTAGSVAAAEEAIEADTVEAGKDISYTGGGEMVDAEPDDDLKGHKFEQSWIEIELVDEAGMPVIGETFEIIGPDGKRIANGITGQNGVGRVLLPEKATYQISFPKLDAAAWEKA